MTGRTASCEAWNCGGKLGGPLDDDEHGGSLMPIFALAHEHHPDPDMRPYKEPISAESVRG